MGEGQVVTESCWPKVTIMIPTYGQEQYIHDAISSALAQDYPNLEVIVGDDASPDKTGEIVAQYSDARLIYVRNKTNLGRTGNYKNLLYNVATGSWVVNLDGDDYYTDPAFISRAIQLALSDPKIVMVQAQCTTQDGSWVSQMPGFPNLSGLEIVKKLPSPVFFFKHMGALYKRTLAVELDFYRSPALSSDWESLYRLALRGRVAYLDKIVGEWRIHGNNLSLAKNYAILASNLRIWAPIFEDAEKFGLSRFWARVARVRTIAFFAKIYWPRVLRSPKRKDIYRYLIQVYKIEPMVAVMTALSPLNIEKLVGCLFGFYKNRP